VILQGGNDSFFDFAGCLSKEDEILVKNFLTLDGYNAKK